MDKEGNTHVQQFRHVQVDTKEALLDALEKLKGFTQYALDCEGIYLGRRGSLTILTVKAIDESGDPTLHPAYVFDVQQLDGAMVFDASGGFLKDMIENPMIKKITFDCRADSDALWHQFRVKLTNVLDLQVYDQAVRIHEGESAPARRGTFLPYIPPMRSVAPKHVASRTMRELRGGREPPHKSDEGVWGIRPLPVVAWIYAAADVHLIDLVLRSMKARNVSSHLLLRVDIHSDRYTKHFRERVMEVRHVQDKNFIMEERSILGEFRG